MLICSRNICLVVPRHILVLPKHNLGLFMHVFVLTLQNFINKHTANVENVEGKKKNEKDQFTRRETNTN